MQATNPRSDLISEARLSFWIIGSLLGAMVTTTRPSTLHQRGRAAGLLHVARGRWTTALFSHLGNSSVWIGADSFRAQLAKCTL